MIHLSRGGRSLPGIWLAAAVLTQTAFAQNGVPLPEDGGDLQGLAPTRAGQHWPGILAPAGNPFEASPDDPFVPLEDSDTERRYLLGKALFWEEQVSSDNTMACGTCHSPAFGGLDPRLTFPGPSGTSGSLGMIPQDSAGQYIAEAGLVQDRRVTPLAPASTITGAAFKTSSFWDGRVGPGFFDEAGTLLFADAAALEAQAVEPPTNPIEMCQNGLTWSANSGTASIESKLGPARPLALASDLPGDLDGFQQSYATYDEAFDATYAGTAYGGPLGVNRERFAMAIATYERTLVPNEAPVDLGDLPDPAAPDPSPTRGFNLFKDSCIFCHSDRNAIRSPLPFGLKSGGGFNNPFDSMLTNGQRERNNGLPGTSGFPGDEGVVTPSLRNVALKKSFFHNGSLSSLEDVIRFYNKEIPGTTPAYIFGPPLDEQGKQDVLAFLESLTDQRIVNGEFPFDRPTLYSERVPHGTNEAGNPTPNPGPDLLANAPLLDGDSGFKIGVAGALPNAPGFLGISLAPASGPVVWIGATGLLTFPIQTDADGVATFEPGPFPAGLQGLTFYGQAWVDGEFSNRAEWTVQ